MNVLKGLNKKIKNTMLESEEAVVKFADKFGATITPNMRALRLSMTVADYLLSMNVPVSDVVSASITITNKYCQRKVAIDISSNVLMFSQDRGLDREPLTLIRTSPLRYVNVDIIQNIEELVEYIKKGRLSLDEAEVRLERIISKPKEQPRWLLNIGGAGISAGVGALLSGSFLIIVLSFIVGWLISELLYWLYQKNIPPFFIQAFAASMTMLIAALVTWLGNNGVDTLAEVNPNLIVIGGIVMLVAGLAIVGAVQDAIDEYYVTANARILRVFMMTAGIVAGVVLGLYISTQLLGVEMVINIDTRAYELLSWQFAGAALIAAGYALSVHGRLKAVLLSAFLGMASWGVFVLSVSPFSSVVASFMAAATVGILATMLSSWSRIPSSALITAGIIPLVPGLALFQGLMLLFVNDPNFTSGIDSGGPSLLSALLVALAIAAGATFGNIFTRPLRHTIVRAQNVLPNRFIKP